MTYTVHQPWDPLRVCAVGRSYPPEYYAGISNTKIRQVLERIATETEDDYDNLIKVLKSFDVEVIRTQLPTQFPRNTLSGKQFPPPMTPRDHMAMIGDVFYMPTLTGSKWNTLRGDAWPKTPPLSDREFDLLPDSIKQELKAFGVDCAYSVHDYDHTSLAPIQELVMQQGNTIVYDKKIDSAMVARVGKDLFFGTWHAHSNLEDIKNNMQALFPDYRCHVINTAGHLDGTFCVVKPGLIVASREIGGDVFKTNFPGWEVYYVDQQPIENKFFLDLKKQTQGKWWVPGEEANQDFINYVETYVNNWLGYVEETIIDVNMLSIDENNILCVRENPELFKVLESHGVTPHVVDFRHYMFWDGGLHCVTNDLHRQGQLVDYFPNRHSL